jgi:hypothetical protein
LQRSEVPVDRFLGELDDPRADDLRALDRLVSAELSGLERVLWTGVMWGGTEQRIIGYGGITQPRPRGEPVSWFLVGLAMQKSTLSVYVNAAEDGEYLVRRRAGLLGEVKVGSAVINVKAADDLDRTGFTDLLRRARELTPNAT